MNPSSVSGLVADQQLHLDLEGADGGHRRGDGGGRPQLRLQQRGAVRLRHQVGPA